MSKALARAFPRSNALQHRPVKKQVQENRIRLATCNGKTLICKSMELVDTMRRRRVNIAFKKIDRYKLWYTRKDNNKNGVGIIVDKDLKDKVINVKRIGGRLLFIKLSLKEEIINVISAYAPQV
ncbi:hypothetical protein AMTRI_Chr13g88450 [Amborella trichopoda]